MTKSSLIAAGIKPVHRIQAVVRIASDKAGWVHQDSNLEPIGYEPTALTIELWTRFAA